MSREYKGSGQGGWAVGKVGNIETRTDKKRQEQTRHNSTLYKTSHR